jgi:Iron-sulfur cluster-binding domain
VKKHSPKVSMRDEFFRDCVRQALEIGYRRFELTPCTGDVFMDRHILNKLQFLEQHPDVDGYQFFTNFTIPRQRDIDRLLRLQKLERLTISVYGHDLESFVAITESTEKIYLRLIANLEKLFGALGERKFELELGLRSTRAMPRRASGPLLELIDRFERAGVAVRRSRRYNNWGGLITAADVEGLGIDIKGAESVYKNGACVLLFTSIQIMATGIVNGCACRDANATLRIGDLNTTPLRDIISTRNAAYMGLIEEQQCGDFRPICRSCDFYKSIYHKRAKDRRSGTALRSLAEFNTRLDAAAARD